MRAHSDWTMCLWPRYAHSDGAHTSTSPIATCRKHLAGMWAIAHDGTIGTKQHQKWCAYIFAECIRFIVRFVSEEGAFCQLRPYGQHSRPQEPQTELDARNVQHDNPWQGEEDGVGGEVVCA